LAQRCVPGMDLPPEGDEVAVERDVIDHPVREGDLADVDELAAADRVLDLHDLKRAVKKPEKMEKNETRENTLINILNTACQSVHLFIIK
jgi:hypothetical protein